MSEPRMFTVIRNGDYSGVSGTGRVIDGVVFSNGKVAISWRHALTSVSYFDSFEIFQMIHLDSHPTNRSEVIWLDQSGMEIKPEESPAENPTLITNKQQKT